jgi:hypothetical protein
MNTNLSHLKEFVISLRRQQEEDEIGTEETERKQAIADIRFGEPYENTRKISKFDVLGEDLVVVPVEIEIDSMLYNLIQTDILSHFGADHGMKFQEWVNICFKERMEQIVTDPNEYGKLVLNQIRRNHCLPEVDIQK